jgi:hypothetical protein
VVGVVVSDEQLVVSRIATTQRLSLAVLIMAVNDAGDIGL